MHVSWGMVTPQLGLTRNVLEIVWDGVTQTLSIPVIQGGQRKLAAGAPLLKSLSLFGLPILPATQNFPQQISFPILIYPKSLITAISPR